MSDGANTKLRNTAAVIEAFGGIRPMAHKLGVPVSTVQGWKQRNAIPDNRVADILAAAATHSVDLANIATPFDTTKETTADSPEPDEANAAPATAPPSTARPQPQKQSGGDRSALLVAVIALTVALGAGGWLLLGGGDQSVATAPGPDFAQVTDRLDALEAARPDGGSETLQRQVSADIADLRAEIGRITEAQTGLAPPTVDIDALADRLEAVETELDRVQSEAARAAQAATVALSAAQDEITQLRRRLTALGENRTITGQNVAGAVGLALATGTLRRAMDNGEPYHDVLATLRTLAAGDTAIDAVLDRLAEGAGAGVPTRDALAVSFPSVARNVAAASADPAGGWTERALQRIQNTVSIRRIGPAVPGDAPDARIARAEAKLLAGDLSAAVAELDALQGAAATAAASWLDGAQLRLDAEAAADELEALAIARLQAGNGGS